MLRATSFSRSLMVRSSRTSLVSGVNVLTTRGASSQLTPEEIKKMRPSSPHFTIYQPQLTWYLSILNRITGVGVAGLFYGAGLFAAAGAGTADFAAVVAATPAPLLFLGKTALVVPFSFHTCNGIRHLYWDTGRGLMLKDVYYNGYMCMAATTVMSLGLLMW